MIYTYGVVERQLSLRVVDASMGRHTEALLPLGDIAAWHDSSFRIPAFKDQSNSASPYKYNFVFYDIYQCM